MVASDVAAFLLFGSFFSFIFLATLLMQQLILLGTFFVLPVYLQVILGLDACEQLRGQGSSAEPIAEKCRAIARIAVEGRAEIGTRAKQSSPIVVAPEGADPADLQPGW